MTDVKVRVVGDAGLKVGVVGDDRCEGWGGR